MTGFTKFWFIAGGGIHGAWKRRRWTDLKNLAQKLPERAWNEAIEQSALLIEQETRRDWSPQEYAFRIRKMKTDAAHASPAAKEALEGSK